MVGAGEVDVDFADEGAGEVGIAKGCVVGSGLFERPLLVGSEL